MLLHHTPSKHQRPLHRRTYPPIKPLVTWRVERCVDGHWTIVGFVDSWEERDALKQALAQYGADSFDAFGVAQPVRVTLKNAAAPGETSPFVAALAEMDRSPFRTGLPDALSIQGHEIESGLPDVGV